MNIHAIICTRCREEMTTMTDNLISYFAKAGVNVLVIAGASSIFKAYEGAYATISPDPEDIIIFCHDDIEIREKPEVFLNFLKGTLENEETGFVGAAGTTLLNEDPIWWDQNNHRRGFHRGRVTHITPEGEEYETFFGPAGDVVVLDGLFLAAKPKVIEDIGLKKPDYFVGEWDFYDIHYTSQAFLKGYINKAIHFNIFHNSRGELVGRESWHQNKELFRLNTSLPLQLHI